MQQGPLAGVKIVDLTSFVSGPFACSVLADLGGSVIKVEPPGGDTQRSYPSTLKAESRVFLGINRGKRSIVLNLKDGAARDILFNLVRDADILVENFRPGVTARLGIDYPALRNQNQRLIYCGIRGYGDSGPMSEHPGYDQVMQTMSGIAVFQGSTSENSFPQLVRGALIDFYAAMMATTGILAALYQRQQTGEGQYVSTSLLAAALTMQAGRFVWADNEPRDVNRDLLPGGIANIHPTKSGGLYISAHTEKFWQNLCRFVGLPEFAEDERYNSSRKRSDRAAELLPKLHEALRRRPAKEWAELMAGEVPCATVGAIEDMFDHPQVIEQNLVSHYEHGEVGGYRALSNPIHFSNAARVDSRAAPLIGEQTNEVLKEYGYSKTQIAELRSKGAVG